MVLTTNDFDDRDYDFYDFSLYRVIDCSFEPINQENTKLMQRLSNHQGVVLTSDASLRRAPFYYNNPMMHRYAADLKDNIVLSRDKEVLISALMQNPRYHRVMLFDFLYNHDMLADNTITFNSKRIPITDSQVSYNDKIKYESMSIGIDNCNSSYHVADGYNDPVLKSYYDIVTETLFCKLGIFISEKSYRFAMHGCVPLFIGQYGLVNEIRSQGFDVFDDIINHSYDSVTSHTRRMELVFEEIRKLKKYNIELLMPRFVKNRERLEQLSDEYPLPCSFV